MTEKEQGRDGARTWREPDADWSRTTRRQYKLAVSTLNHCVFEGIVPE